MTVDFFFDPPVQPPDSEIPPAAAAEPPAEGDPIDSDELVSWVHGTLLPLIQRSQNKVLWCPLWYEHAEAVFRLHLVHKAWEKAVVSDDPEALSSWALYHLDGHLAVLLSPTGPFSECRYTTRHGFRDGSSHSPHHGLTVIDPPDLAPAPDGDQ